MTGLPDLTPLLGGFSGETFLTSYAGEEAVVRIYGRRSAKRGPEGAEIDSAVLALVRGLIPVPEVFEARRGEAGGMPALLITSKLPGERLDLVLPALDADARLVVADHLGTLLGRLGHLAQPRAGMFADANLLIDGFPDGDDLTDFVAENVHALGLTDDEQEGLVRLADQAQGLLDEERRFCLVHSDFNPKNLLIDPLTLAISGVLDWEFSHAGSPYADLGNLLRFEDDPAFREVVVSSYAAFMPVVPDRLVERADAADLRALIDLATRRAENTVAERAHTQLRSRISQLDSHA